MTTPSPLPDHLPRGHSDRVRNWRKARRVKRPSVRLQGRPYERCWHFVESEDGGTIKTRCGRKLDSARAQLAKRTLEDGYRCLPCGWSVLREAGVIK
jgi:hypothetical protein